MGSDRRRWQFNNLMEVLMKYENVLRKSDEGNSVSAPGLPGY